MPTALQHAVIGSLKRAADTKDPYKGWILPVGLTKVPGWWYDQIDNALFGTDKTTKGIRGNVNLRNQAIAAANRE